jgi:UDP-N-acetylmuramoyl-tripeptide--D-alanyl-D-alanine ligase
MSLFTLSQAAQWLQAQRTGPDVPVTSVGSDSRSLTPGQLFVALQGPSFDGHAFARQALERGAAALLVQRPLDVDLPQLLVEDTRLALGRLAGAWRSTLRGRVVAVTGSNGKTTCKEMIAAILARAGSVTATRGNLNNDIGLPLTLLGCGAQDYLVLEMGANHPGEIAYLSAIARPDLSLITNAGRAHLEGFGTLDGVARAKGEIIGGTARNGAFLLNADDRYAPLWRELAGTRRVLSFGLDQPAQVALEPGSWKLWLDGDGFHSSCRLRTPRGGLDIDLRLAGRHNLMNALAAVAVGEALEIDRQAIQAGLAGMRPVAGRLCPLPGVGGARVIDDSYNANPDSLGAALDLLGQLSGRRWLVLGDMGELGEDARSLHREIGQQARRSGVERLWATGELSAEAVDGFGEGGRRFADREALSEELRSVLGNRDLVLVKGSRAAAMDSVSKAITLGGGD